MKNQTPETGVEFGTQLAWLSVLLLHDGKTEEAKPHFEKAYRIFQNNQHNTEASLDWMKILISECLLLMNRRDEALPLLEERCEFYKATYPPNFRYRISAEQLLDQAQASPNKK